MLALIASGQAGLVIGTHAVIQDKVQFQRLVDAMPEQWQKSFADTKRGWIEQGMADPVVGGAAWKTSVQAANDVLANTALIPKSDRAAFNAMMRDTGQVRSDWRAASRTWVATARACSGVRAGTCTSMPDGPCPKDRVCQCTSPSASPGGR